MSRSNQFIGLSWEAKAWLDKNCEKREVSECPCCHNKTGGDLYAETTSCYEGMFDEKFPLHKYWRHDGSEVFEFVQAAPWSSGPMIFLALSTVQIVGCPTEEEDKLVIKESLWSDEVINAA